MASARTMVLACALAWASFPALAQSSLEGSTDETTTAETASKLLQPVDSARDAELAAQLEANGVEAAEEGAESAIDPFAAQEGPLTLMNCSGESVRVKTYNSSDPVLWVPYKEYSVDNGASVGLQCATGSCKVKIGSGGATGAVSGYKVLLDGGMRETNEAAMAEGCAVYQ